MKVAINIGHSQTKPGAIDAIQPSEEDYRYSREESDNNRFAGFLAAALLSEGAEVKLFQQQGNETLKSIADKIMEWDPDLVVSLHRNNVASSKPSGWSVWHHADSAPDKNLAKEIAKQLGKVSSIWKDTAGSVRSDYEVYPPTSSSSGGFSILRNTSGVPSALIEFGFMSNPKDEVWFDDVIILRDSSLAVTSAIKKYLEGE